MINTNDLRRGQAIMYEGQPYLVLDVHHHKPGKGAAVVRTKLRNLLTNSSSDPTFRSGDKVEKADLEEKDGQFLYESEGSYHVMDPSSFEQYEVAGDVIGDNKNFMMENMEVKLLFYQGKIISIDLPNHVVLEVVSCAPAVKGDTVSGATKPATVSTGYILHVPLFINEGDRLKIDTRTGEYIERSKA